MTKNTNNGRLMWTAIGVVVAGTLAFYTMVIIPIASSVDTLDSEKADTVDCVERNENLKQYISDFKKDNKEEHNEMKTDIKEILKEVRKLNHDL